MPSRQGDLFDASDNEDHVRPLSIGKRQRYVQLGDGLSATSSRQPFMASANGDDEAPVRPLSICKRDRNVRPQCASPGGSSRPSSVHYEGEPDEAPTPRAGSPVPSLASQARGETEHFAKRSVSDIRKTFEAVSNDNDSGSAAGRIKVLKGQPSAAPQHDIHSTKTVSSIRRLTQAFAHSETEAEDEYPDEGSRMPRQPQLQGWLHDGLDKLDQEQIPSRGCSVASSRRSSCTPSIHEETDAREERRDPVSARQPHPSAAHQETYDALHGHGPATVPPPQASSQPSSDDTSGPRRDPATRYRHSLRAPSINEETTWEHEDEEGARVLRTSHMPGSSPSRGAAGELDGNYVVSSRRPSRASFLDNIENEVDAEYARRTKRETEEEQASCRSSVISTRRESGAPPADSIEEIEAHHPRRAGRKGKQLAKEQASYQHAAASSLRTSRALDIIEEEIEAEYARRKQREAEEQQTCRESVSSPRCSSRVPMDNIEEQIEAEYARGARKEAEEQQPRKSYVAMFKRPSRAPAMSVDEEVEAEEVEALYARSDASYRRQVPELDDGGTVTPRAVSPSRRSSSRPRATSSFHSSTSPAYRYEENQLPAYTPSRRSSIHARRDFRSLDSTCRSSWDESNIHPAFRTEPYFSPSSSRREFRAEPLDHRWSEARPSSGASERECNTMKSLCGECCHVLKAVQPDVSEKCLECPPSIHPVLVECILTGTSDDAAAIVGDLHERITKYTSCRFDLYAAVRRSATSGHRSGHWYNITTKELPSSRACPISRHYENKSPGAIQSVFYSPYSWAKKQEEKKLKHIKESHVKLRDMMILMDFPWQIEKGGMIERKIFQSLPKNVKVTKLKHIWAHHTLHRLEWWARTHPVYHYTTDASWERGEYSMFRERGSDDQYPRRPFESSSTERERNSQNIRRPSEPSSKERDRHYSCPPSESSSTDRGHDRDFGRRDSQLDSCRTSRISFR
ncbi:hypothetical protein BDW75DRAFT_237802 [Aspergillus navahoensis]